MIIFIKNEIELLKKMEGGHMAKKCAECGTENQDSADFCQNCGNDLTGVAAAQPPSKGGSMGWWNKQSKGVKAGLIIGGICCLGLIVIIAMSAMSTPDNNTSKYRNNPIHNSSPCPSRIRKSIQSIM